jgi:putative transposase
MKLRKRAYKYRLYPTLDQIPLLSQSFGHVRFVWNQLVSDFTARQKSVSLVELKALHPFLQTVSAAILQQKQRDFQETKAQFFNKKRKKRIGRPKCRKKGKRDSFRLPFPKFKRFGDLIQLEKIGKIRFVEDRPIPQNAKWLSVTVSRNASNQYFISVLVEETIAPKSKTHQVVGCDLGLKSFVVTSDFDVFEPQKAYRKNQAKLKTAQKHLSRKQKGSQRRNKQRVKVARIHQKTVNQRHDFIHKVTTHLVNHFDTIVIEDLNVSGMVRNRRLSKAISDAGFRMFRTQLEYKCDWYDKKLVIADRFYASSKTCSGCGFQKATFRLAERTFECEKCRVCLDRDLNAALNLKKLAV